MALLPANMAHFAFDVAGLTQQLRVTHFVGDEALSAPFSFTIDLASDDPEIAFASVLGKPARLTMYSDNGERYVNGLLSAFEQQGDRGRFTLYQAVLVPHLWLLGLRQRSRIFQQLSVPDIIAQVLREAGVASDRYRFVLQNTYTAREYCVQYRETDLHFVSRLLEEEGIFYFFEHTAAHHVLVMADGPAAHTNIVAPATLPFRDPAGMVTSEEYVFQYSYGESIRPGAVMLHDFDFAKPALNLRSTAQAEQFPALEMYDYPGAFLTPERGTALARRRLEALQMPRQVGRGASVCRRLLPGYRMTLSQHPRAEFNKAYIITHVHHAAAQPQALEEFSSAAGTDYANEFRCIPATVPFRPVPTTPKPLVYGSQTAIVVGPPGEEIYTNEHGQVKVQFHWDREGKSNEQSSCWIRVSQSWAGAAWGSLHLPRVGQEVIVHFLEGDPDRPLITGRVYNGEQPPPYPLPAEKTKSTIKSQSSKGGGGFNEIRFDDAKGAEQIFVHAEKDAHTRIKHDALTWIGHDQHVVVKHDHFAQIDGTAHHTVQGDQHERVAGTVSRQAGEDLQEQVGFKYALEAGREIHLKAGMNIVLEAGLSITLKAGGGFIVVGPAGVTISGMPVRINSGGSAGSGSGASPETPEAPLEATTANPGRQTHQRAAAPAPFVPLTSAMLAQVQVLKDAARRGTPFCEKCP